jgi:hypothetical protein
MLLVNAGRIKYRGFGEKYRHIVTEAHSVVSLALHIYSVSQEIQSFMEPEDKSSCSQKPATGH